MVVQSLLLIGAQTHLRHLTIGFSLHDTSVDGSPWGDLQDLLLGTSFSALASVEFHLLGNPSDCNPVSVEPFVTAVPRLAQKGMISVCHCPC